MYIILLMSKVFLLVHIEVHGRVFEYVDITVHLL